MADPIRRDGGPAEISACCRSGAGQQACHWLVMVQAADGIGRATAGSGGNGRCTGGAAALLVNR
jgi:hypothetical protein